MSGGTSGDPRSGGAVEAELQWAIGALNHGQLEDAERFARNVLARIPQHPKALYVLGCALLRQNRATHAVAPLERAARALQDAVVETELAEALRQTDRQEDALAALRRAIKRRPAYPEAFHQLGFLLLSLRRMDEAVGVVERGVALAPEMVELPVLLGVIHHGRCDRAQARAAFARALALAPDH